METGWDEWLEQAFSTFFKKYYSSIEYIATGTAATVVSERRSANSWTGWVC
eukprot:COSAG02_NODE_7_length_64539_cov_120.393482_9_plen_51_part_00